jgi:hypothetical protein
MVVCKKCKGNKGICGCKEEETTKFTPRLSIWTDYRAHVNSTGTACAGDW